MLIVLVYHGKEINMTSDNVTISSNNFSVDKYGNINASGGTIGGYTLSSTKFLNNYNGIYNYNDYDLRTATSVNMEWIYPTSPILAVDDYDNTGEIDGADLLHIQKILNGQETNTKTVLGKFEINADNPKEFITVTTEGSKSVSIGAEGIDANIVNTENLMCGYKSGNYFYGVLANGHTGQLTCARQISGGNNSTTTTKVTPDGIITPTVTQTSKKEEKKNFEKFENALNIIKDIDIYKYNLKEEQDGNKKHIGFVIGNEYNYSEEVTSKDNDGVDIYSFVSLCCQAIKEQQEEIDLLKEEIRLLKEGGR